MPVILALCVLLLALAAPTAPARAHAALVEASPSDGQLLPEAPRVARLRFNEPVSALIVRLIAGSGQTWSGLTVRAANGAVEVELPPDLGQGSHVLSYRVISADGHPIGGSLIFAIGHATGRPEFIEERDASASGLLWLARVLMYVGLFIGTGGAFFLAWMARDAPRKATRITQAAIVTGLAASVLSIGYQGLDALAATLRSYWTIPVWSTGFGTSFGATAAATACALLSAYVSLVAPAARRAFAAIGLLGIGLALSLSGHASAAGPWWLTRTGVFVHAVCVAYWVGGLASLAVLLACPNDSIATIVKKWSGGAVAAVTALVVTGAVLTLIQVPRWAALTETAYGRILLAKLAAVAALLGLAAFNRFGLTPELVSDGHGQRRLQVSIAAELALAVVILGLVAMWRFTPPPRAIAPAIAPAASVHLHGDKGMAEVVLRPGQAGPVRAVITLYDADGRPLDAKEVRLVLANRAAGIEPIARKAARSGEGAWQADMMLPVAGRWQVRVDALISDFEKLMLEDEIDLKRR